MRSLISLLLAAVICAGQQASPPNEASRQLFQQIDPILQELSGITGWKVKRKVPAAFISKDQLHAFVAKRLRDVVKPEEVRIEALTLKMFGLIPDDFDLEKATIDLVTEQAAAFYDYNKKRLFITESGGSFIEQRIVLVHELAHALADQQFSLSRYIRKGNASDDDATAREAVMEGQATWLMWAYSQKVAGSDPRPSESILETMKSSGSTGANAQYPVFEKAPLYMRESLVFPYNQGTLFQDAVLKRDGNAGFAEVFRSPPVSTSQILHPDLYFRHATALKLKPPSPPEHKHYRTLAEGSAGEFDHHILLQQYVSASEADRLSPHWRGGAFKLYEDKRDREAVLTYVSEWDSTEAAAQWCEFYKHILEVRNAPGRFHVWLDEKRVTSLVSRAVK